MLDQPLVILDVETTGAHPAYDRITEVGLIEVDRGRCVGEWSTLVNPQESITPDEFVAFVRRELEKWARVAKAANVKLD